MTVRDYLPLLEAFALFALVLIAAILLVWYLEQRKRDRQAKLQRDNMDNIAKRLSQYASPKEMVPYEPALARHRPALQPLLSRVRGRREPAKMPSVIYLPNRFDPQTLRWPPKCVYCGEPNQTEIPTTITMSNKERATIRIPYCIRHSQEATQNRRIINAAQWASRLAGILLGMCGLAALAFGGSLGTRFPFMDCNDAFIDCVTTYIENVIDTVESVLWLVALAVFVSVEGPDLALRVLSRLMPSLKHSQNPYTLLGLGVSDTTMTFLNDETAADFKRINLRIP